MISDLNINMKLQSKLCWHKPSSYRRSYTTYILTDISRKSQLTGNKIQHESKYSNTLLF